MKLLVILISLLFSSLIGATQTFNTVYENPFLELGSSTGWSLHIHEDSIYVFGTINDQSTGATGIGCLLKYNLSGELSSAVYYNPLDTLLNASLGKWGGVDFNNEYDESFFTVPYNEFINWQDTLIESENIQLLDIYGLEISRHELEWEPFGKLMLGASSKSLNEHIIYGSAWDEDGIGTQTDNGFLLSCNSLGETNWVHRYENITGIKFMTIIPSGGFLLGGDIWWATNENGPNNFHDQVVIRTNNLGEEQWRYIYGDTGHEAYSPVCVCVCDDGTFVTLGIDKLPFQGPGDKPLWFQRIQDSGDSYEVIDELLWEFPPAHDHIPYGVKQVSDGGIVGYGFGKPEWDETIPDVPPRGFLYKVDQNLDSLWKRYYGHYTTEVDAHHAFHDMVEGPDSCLYLTGIASRGEGTGVFGLGHIWLVKTDSYGCLEPGCHLLPEDTTDNIVQIIGLQNSMKTFPNPVKDRFTVEFNLPLDFQLPPYSTLKLIDQTGREVKHITLENMNHSFSTEISAEDLSSGIYTLHWMEGNKWFDSMKIVVE